MQRHLVLFVQAPQKQLQKTTVTTTMYVGQILLSITQRKKKSSTNIDFYSHRKSFYPVRIIYENGTYL